MNIRMSWRKNWPDLEAMLFGGFPSFVTSRNPSALPDGIPVFCYHAADAGTVDADFAFLKDNGYRTCTADELSTYMNGGQMLHDRTVALTVDDGAYNLYDVLFPCLRRYGFNATAFVPTAFIRDSYDLPNRSRPCTWEELREMDSSGHVDVQAHTHAHRYVPNWPEPVDLVGIDPAFSREVQQGAALPIEEDFSLAKNRILDKLGKSAPHMAFPMYSGTDKAVNCGIVAGYETFWWGTLPGRRANKPGDPVTHIVRISSEFLRRLPGRGRVTFGSIIRKRLGKRS